MSGRIERWARELKLEALTVWYISRNAETPWHVRAFAVLLVAYAFSPIDLIPDLIPVIGYVDDLVILPLGVYLLLKITPEHLIVEARASARNHIARHAAKPISRAGLLLTVLVWALALVALAALIRYRSSTGRAGNN